MSEIAKLCSGKWIGESDHLILKRHKLTYHLSSSTDVAIVGTQAIQAIDFQHLSGIVRLGVGYDNIPADELRAAGVSLAYTPNAPSQYVAEHAFALMMSALRFRTREQLGLSLEEITVALIGRGRIGKRFAAGLARLSVKIIAVDPVRDTTFDEIHNITRTDLKTALRIADVVSLHVPLCPATHHMINEETLNLMKRDAVLVNTSRGGVVNENHLLDHLDKNKFFRAALDVCQVEPYNGPLGFRANCIMTPHVSSMTLPARKTMELHAIKAAVEIAEGRRPEWPIPEVEPWEEVS